MLGRHVYRVSPAGQGWRVAKDGEEQARGERATREEAISLACELAQADEPARVTVEDPGGHVTEERKFGIDRGQAIDAT